jgi:hypothetical protein
MGSCHTLAYLSLTSINKGESLSIVLQLQGLGYPLCSLSILCQ